MHLRYLDQLVVWFGVKRVPPARGHQHQEMYNCLRLVPRAGGIFFCEKFADGR